MEMANEVGALAPVLRACVQCGKPGPESYCLEHKPKPRGQRRKERMGLSGGAWETLRRKVIARDLECCFVCGQVGGELEVDHLVPVSEGGGNELTNLATCHKACHARRHREPEWARERVESALSVLSDPKGGAGEPPNGFEHQARRGADRARADAPRGEV